MFGNLLSEFTAYAEAGGWVMPPLILATLVLWFAIGYRFAALKRGSVRDVRNMVRRHDKGKTPTQRGVISRALAKGIELRDAGKDELRPYLDDAFFAEEREIRKFDRVIVTIVSAAPLLGLLGTVIGMIETFDSLGDMSLFSQSGGIAGGISQALITTQMGLAVAIPGLIVNGALKRRQKNIELELAQLKDILCSEPSMASGDAGPADSRRP
ncbi:MAG: MotA/TolQ/ExbB proton channel family protein [Xanthomonadales bacterium]|jgi:biopolymer transport protein ExbB|nr:MotA/TolQ/ExbB proton channel family protein [Xanthomonadales bacterium]